MSHELKLKKWSQFHALVLILVTINFYLTLVIWPVVLLGFISIVIFHLLSFVEFPALRNSYGPANVITCVRITGIMIIACVHPYVSNTLIGYLFICALLLDYLDGTVARRTDRVSRFGELFDMESDAFYVLITGLLLIKKLIFPEWIILIAVLRYVFVLLRIIFPVNRQLDKKIRLYSYIAGFLFIALACRFIWQNDLSYYALVLTSILVIFSFVDEFVRSRI